MRPSSLCKESLIAIFGVLLSYKDEAPFVRWDYLPALLVKIRIVADIDAKTVSPDAQNTFIKIHRRPIV